MVCAESKGIPPILARMDARDRDTVASFGIIGQTSPKFAVEIPIRMD